MNSRTLLIVSLLVGLATQVEAGLFGRLMGRRSGCSSGNCGNSSSYGNSQASSQGDCTSGQCAVPTATSGGTATAIMEAEVTPKLVPSTMHWFVSSDRVARREVAMIGNAPSYNEPPQDANALVRAFYANSVIAQDTSQTSRR